jgi:transcription-repair coupling factor (superfamily II helicase)
MQLNGLTSLLTRHPAFDALITQLSRGIPSPLPIPRAARPYLIASIAQAFSDVPVVVITGRIKRAYNMAEQLPVWTDSQVLRFAEPVPQFYERATWGDEAIRNRVATLANLMDDDASPLVVTSARALMQRTLPVGDFRRNTIKLKTGDRISIDKLLTSLTALGYSPATIVTEPSQFSRRGGVIDVFPTAFRQPVRIDFFDDEVDTLKLFDVNTQRSHDKLSQVIITPAREALPERGADVAGLLNDWFQSLPPDVEDRNAPNKDAPLLENRASFPHIEHYLPYMTPHPVSLLDYVPEGALIIVEDGEDLQSIIEELDEQAQIRRADLIKKNLLPPNMPPPYINWAQLADTLARHHVLYLGHDTGGQSTEFDDLFHVSSRWGGQVRKMLTDFRAMRDKGDRLVIVTEQAERLKQLWYEQDASDFIPTVQDITEIPAPQSLTFCIGTLSEGWTLHLEDGNLHLMTDAEIFGWSRPEPRRRTTAQKRKTPESDYADWREGDFVVHVDYGIGVFSGLVHRTVDGNEREYLLLKYADGDTVYVPIHQADRLTKYIGADDRTPTLNKLGKQDWTKVKNRVKKAVQEEADELLTIYAERANATGFAFSPDDHWQHELEASFAYVETDDQLRSLREVKADMESPHPMDRLICGDVGYGKTEVALRAAFKAVNDGKQVAVLVPTTVLAQQHYLTFVNRLAPFPVKVETLSRFRTKEEQSRMMPLIASGEVDIIIGTHRLLSNDVTFHDLGLVIIDEEQRFGVKHKEHFKALRSQVDVLTLTATPIPRTLYMSLTGVRDISMIQTPPEERLPVITHTGRFDEHLVRQAILRELERGGQVFVIHNRVNTIDHLREKLEEIVPEARTIVGHGQMGERQLEAVMDAFQRHQYDILIATTIIESGIDIPNANTLIIDRADHMGLSQLYQLRGRVGRSSQQGYAYFFHPAKMTEEAQARLETLAENTHLGAGFDIAMRDLEIRGAGDILSTRQTGQVSAVGLHLYTQLLTQAINNLKDQTLPIDIPEDTKGIVIELPLPAYIPHDWMPEIALRLQIYRRIAGLTEREQINAMRTELIDRFGQLPVAVDNMLYQIEVKILAQGANATHILARDGQVQVKLPYLGEINRPLLEQHLGENVEVSRVAVTFPCDKDELWKLRLLDMLSALRINVSKLESNGGGI